MSQKIHLGARIAASMDYATTVGAIGLQCALLAMRCFDSQVH
jgi:hypothetical protein